MYLPEDVILEWVKKAMEGKVGLENRPFFEDRSSMVSSKFFYSRKEKDYWLAVLVIPGLTKKTLTIEANMSKNTITVKGKYKSDFFKDIWGDVLNDVKDYHQVFNVPSGVDIENPEVDSNGGILKMKFPLLKDDCRKIL